MKRTIIINSETWGRGNEELGKQLMDSFLRKLLALGSKPDVIIFYNSGVRLLAQGSLVTDALDALYNTGVDMIACGTCVAYFQQQYP